MKKEIKIAATLILASATLLSTLPTQALASGFESHGKFATWSPVGLDRHANLRKAVENKPYSKVQIKDKKLDLKGRIHESNKSKRWNPIALPDSIDPRGTAQETPVRDQGYQSLCWAYATTDVLAINQFKQTGYKAEYSPNFYNYAKAGNTFESEAEYDNYFADSASTNPYAEWWGNGYGLLGDGGDPTLLANNLQLHQLGQVKEADFPSVEYDANYGVSYGTYDISETPLNELNDLLVKKAGADTTYEVKNVEKVTGISKNITSDSVAEHTQKVKTLIAQYGAATLYINGSLIHPSVTPLKIKGGNPYNEEHNALNVPFDYAEKNHHGNITIPHNGTFNVFGTNHIVSIVGYDDNYSKDNFNEGVKPASDGAFLVKNSWGTNIHDGGYFWVSYEAATIARNDIEAFQVGPHKQHTVLDNAKSVDAADIWANEFPEFQGKTYVAETFDAADVDRAALDINVPIGGEGVTYQATIIEGELNIGGANPNQGSDFDHKASYRGFKPKALKTVTGSAKFAGEQKIPFDYTLKAGHKYTVIVEESVASRDVDVDYLVSDNPYVTADQVSGHGYFGVINGNDVYSLDYKTSNYFITDDYARIILQNSLTLDLK